MEAAIDSGEFWSYEEAKRKCSERYSCFVEIEAKEHMALSPYYIGRFKEGVQEEIQRKIRRWKFSDEHQGIIVAYDNIKLLQRSAEIYDESPFINFDIKVSYIVFKPEVGKKLIGVVNKTSSTHVGCLVHGRFNASLAKPKSCQNGWVGSRLDIGTEFIFRVADLQTVAGVLLIGGHIKDKDVKYFRYPESTSFDETSQELGITDTQESEGSKKKKKKSKDKEKHNETYKLNKLIKAENGSSNHEHGGSTSLSNHVSQLGVSGENSFEDTQDRHKKIKKSKKNGSGTHKMNKPLKSEVNNNSTSSGSVFLGNNSSQLNISESSLDESSSKKKKKWSKEKHKTDKLRKPFIKTEDYISDINSETNEDILTKKEPGSKRKLSDSPVSDKKHKKKKKSKQI